MTPFPQAYSRSSTARRAGIRSRPLFLVGMFAGALAGMALTDSNALAQSNLGIGVLAPALPMPIAAPEPVAMAIEPLDPTVCAREAGGGLKLDGVVVGGDEIDNMAQSRCRLGNEAVVADADAAYVLELTPEERHAAADKVIMPTPRRTQRKWLGSLTPQTGVTTDTRTMTYRNESGQTVAVGSVASNTPWWGQSTQIGGVQLSNWSSSSARTLSQGQFGYSSMVGRIDNTDLSAGAGKLDYGATAGSSSLRYGVTPSMTLESQVETAPTLTAMGLGTTYTAGTLGTFQVGATQSTYERSDARRYRLGYSVDLAHSVTVSYVNEQIDQGFSDLATYEDGAAGARQTRNTLTAGIPISGWGTFSGTYSGLQENNASAERRYGVQHSMALAPRVRMALGADREVVSGEYKMGVKLTMPVDDFMGTLGLGW